MITFSEGGHFYRGYSGGHFFCDGLEITAQAFYEALMARRRG